MEKSINPAPLGLDSALSQLQMQPELMDEDPDAQPGVDGAIEITIETGDDTPDDDEEAPEFDANLAEHIDEAKLGVIATELIGLFEQDMQSRKDWVEMYIKGLEVLGMKYEERTEPWENACGVVSTILTEAAVRFQSETIIETFPASGPVKTEIIGDSTPETEAAAERVRADMNYKLTEDMPEYRPEHERMLYSLGLAGAAFKKVYKDPSLDRQVAMFCPAEDLVIPYGASSAATAERVTHIMRKTKNDIRKLQVGGLYRDVDLGEPVNIQTDVEKHKMQDQGFTLIDDDRYQVLEMHVDWDMPGFEDKDKIALPYVVTIDRYTAKVMAIRRNWKEDDKLRLKRQHFAQYSYIVGFGAYGLGLIHLIGGYARAGTSIIRQLVDAGTLSNLPGGLKARGLRIKGDDTPIEPGEFRDVDVPAGTIRDNVMALPYKEPSQVLLALLNQLTDEGRRLGSIADMEISDSSANSPVGTTLALLERQLKTMSAVQARVHYSMKQEFKLLKDIIAEDADPSYDYTPVGANAAAKQQDYAIVNVIPVSDPNSSTLAQRILTYQAVQQLSTTAPQIYDLPELHRQMITVLGVKNPEKIVPVSEDQKPRDPVSENMAFLMGKPTKAFIFQDHDAHIATHTAMMQDPMVMGQIGQNPQAQAIQASIMAHMCEHIAFQYRSRLEQQLGVTLPAPDTDMPPAVEAQLSQLVAQAAAQLLMVNKGQAAQQQAAQQAQDPLIQIQQGELQVKQQEAQTRTKKVDGDLELAKAELQLKAQAQQGKMAPPPPPQETPEMIAQRHQQELAMNQQAHQQQLAQAAQQQQLAAAAQQQKLAQAAQAHHMKLATGGQVHAQKLSHQQEAHRAKLAQQKEAAAAARAERAKTAKATKPNKKEGE